MKIIRKACRRIKTVLLAALFCLSGSIQAGGSPETTLVVVNADSPLSKAVANHYINLRDIPANHVLYLSDIPSFSPLKIDHFRSKILWPIYQYLVAEKLFDHIDTIAYSADFPYSVDFSADAQRAGVKLNDFTGKVGSLTGLTYFFSQILQGDLSYLSLFPHGYFRQIPDPRHYQKTQISSQATKLLQKARRNHGKKQYEQAVSTLEQLIASNPDLMSAHYLLAKSLTRLEFPNKAMDHLQQAIQLGISNRLTTSNDPDLKRLSALPRFTEILESITSHPVKLLPTLGFSSTDSWRYIRRIPGQGIQTGEVSPSSLNSLSSQHSLPPPNSSTSSFAIQPAARPKMMLAVMLAYTGLRGNGLEEINRYLERAASSDGSAPTGTVYLMANKDIRTETRYPAFDTLIKDMRRINRDAQIIQGVLPIGKKDVIGVVAGSQSYHWAKSKSQLLPGAVAETLTSYGAHFNNPIQTKLSEHLRHGAAGSSGAVAEPYSMWEKFPSPYLHYHYAQGVSLAEAFYQSLASPYQMLIVGDPLSRPFANFAEITVIEDLESTHLQGIIKIFPLSLSPSLIPSHFELWIDGKHAGYTRPGGHFLLNTSALTDGAHELRIVAVENSPIKTRSYKKITITVNNRRQRIRIASKPTPARIQLGEMINLEGILQGHTSSIEQVMLYHGSKLLARVPVKDGRWNYHLSSSTLGVGKSHIQLRSLNPEFRASSRIFSIEVTPPPQIQATEISFHGKPGFIITVTDDSNVERRLNKKILNGRKIRSLTSADRRVSYRGKFKVTGAGLHQLTISGLGRYRIRLGNSFTREISTGSTREVRIPLALSVGWHVLEIIALSNLEHKPMVGVYGMNAGIYLGESWLRH